MDFVNYENHEMTIYEYENDEIYVKNYFGPGSFNGSREINSYIDIDQNVFQGTQILDNVSPYALFYAYKSGRIKDFTLNANSNLELE